VGEFGEVWWSDARRAVEGASSGTCVEWSETKQPAAPTEALCEGKGKRTISKGAAENNPQLIQLRQRSGLLL
jgi:hypothetical protein